MQLGFGSAIILSTLLDIVAIELKPEKDSNASKVSSFVYTCISVHAYNKCMDKLSLLRVCVQTNEHTHTHTHKKIYTHSCTYVHCTFLRQVCQEMNVCACSGVGGG